MLTLFSLQIRGGLVVDIGCGLDTRFHRLDNGRMIWLGLDLPEVIEFRRRRLLPDSERCRSLPRSMFDLAWLDVVAQMQKPVVFLAEGVFPYFTEAEVKRVITALSARFPGAGLAFDALSPFSAGLHNRTSAILKETGARIDWPWMTPAGWSHGNCACWTNGVTSTAMSHAWA
jgi:O-methyltransferase involved in polyketide biosynthesis